MDESTTTLEEDGTLVKVSLTSEDYTDDQNTKCRTLALGVVTLSSTDITVAKLRKIITSELETLPENFRFLAGQRWPILTEQEDTVLTSQILEEENISYIQRCFDKPRVGIETYDGQKIGFIFVNLTCSVKELKDAVTKQLVHIEVIKGGDFKFLDRNGWPITTEKQESSLQVMDIMQGAKVQIYKRGSDFKEDTPSPEEETETVHSPRKRKRSPVLKRQSLDPLALPFVESYDRTDSNSSFESKEVLISYVRAESAMHALKLKVALTGMGFSVYLDVHEIKSGIDWQDSLNYAVSNCEVFVPLVTPRYGETQWTNREVKLADVLAKYIVPVSFLDHWPPKCLAIQFATTQYISWKSQEKILKDLETKSDLEVFDITEWDRADVTHVAKQIGKMLKSTSRQTPLLRGKLSRKSLYMRQHSSSFSDSHSLEFFSQESLEVDGDTDALIVVSLHPQQIAFGTQIKKCLIEEGYRVWCSTELGGWTEKDVSAMFENGPEPGTPEDLITLSQYTQTFSQESEKGDCDKRLLFQEKVDSAGLVICVVSKAYAASRTSRQQVFYCEHRKCVIPLMFEEFNIPGWMSMLIGTGVFETVSSGNHDSLKRRIKKALDPHAQSQEDVNESKICAAAKELERQKPNEVTVYISGGTKFFHNKSESICQAIGKHLAQVEGIQVMTGGFYGVGETVGKSYEEHCIQNRKPNSLWHVLPHSDPQDRTRQARQNKDKTFPPLPFGKTLFAGSCVRERESIVARICDICILVEGGPGAAHETEEFAWNDHVVIPIRCTGGAAGGKFNVPQKIFQVPSNVNPIDWSVLENKEADPDQIGKAVSNIVCSLKERLKLDSPSVLKGQRLNLPDLKAKAKNESST